MHGGNTQHGLEDELAEIFPGDTEMARVMRSHDWSATQLGDPHAWPDALKIPLRMLLTSKFEMWLGWGQDLHFFYNDAYIPTLGIKHPHMLGRPFHEVWSEVYDEVADQVESVRAGVATWNKALLLLLERSGYPEETYHSFSYSPLYEADGSVGGLLCIVSEETARIINERRLETLRQLGMALVGVTDKAAVRAAVQSVFVANRRDFPFAALGLVGEEEGVDVVGADAAAFQHLTAELGSNASDGGRILPLSADAYWPAGDWERAPIEAISIAIPAPSDDATAGWLLLGLNPHRRDDPDILNIAKLIAGQISGALANISALQNERQRADRTQEHFRHLVQGVTDYAIYMLDLQGNVSSWNEGARRIKGYEPEEIIGEHFSRFYTEEDRARGEPVRALETARHEGRFHAEGWRVKKNGERFRASVVIDAIRDDVGTPIGFAKITRDITEREQTQQELEKAREALFQSQKMEAIGQLTGGVAHDFNNLLMAILSSLDLLRKRIPQDALTQRLINNAVEGAQRGATLTQRMLAFARRQDLKVDRIDLSALLTGMSDLVQRSIGPGWPISMNLPLGLPAIRADANQLEMALLNLIVNARDATPGGGSILVTASREDVSAGVVAGLNAGSYVRLAVTDQGTGMDGETLRRATEPFFTTKGVGKGTGLGLPMVHGMAQQIGGAFELLSKPGAGTSAVLWLPIAQSEKISRAVPQVENSPPALPSMKILAVDDDTLVLINTAALLEDLGHDVIEADSAAEALEIIRNLDDIDLIVTDQAMPKMTGADLIAEVEQLRPGMPAIMASGYGEGVECPHPGVVRLSKPFNQTHLARAIVDAVDRAKERRPIPSPLDA